MPWKTDGAMLANAMRAVLAAGRKALVSRQATLAAPPKGVRAASGGVSKAKTAFFALRSSRLLRQCRRGISRDGAARFLQRARPLARRTWLRLRRCNPPVSQKSLRLRLSVFFSLFMIAAWLTAAIFAWQECRDYIDEFFDSQQMLFAKRLATMNFASTVDRLPKTKHVLPGVKKKSFGDLEDEAIGFAVFSREGETLLTDGEKGRRFVFEPGKRGFSTMRLAGKKDVWRIVWLETPDGNHVIAVGQELEYRREMAFDMLEKQLMPWLLLLPALLLGLYILLSRELAPLRGIAAELRTRAPENTTLLDVRKVPSEALPIVAALNDFFARTNAMLARERSFIADAAHELRTPLAGLRVQSQVAAQAGIDPAARNEALGFLRQGIDRCARLVEQLLALSRLEALHEADASAQGLPGGLTAGPIAWAAILEELLGEYRSRLTERGIDAASRIVSLPASVRGYPALAAMLLRNLLENAASYTPDRGHISVTLESNRLTVENTCSDLPEACVSRLGERFFRPPGQREPGSGLGLSIVKRIAELHRFSIALETEKGAAGTSGIFRVTVSW